MHIILRFQNAIIDGAEIDTIAEHCAILKDLGFVHFGVLGKGINPNKILILKEQISQGKETNLYLVSNKKLGFKTYKCQHHLKRSSLLSILSQKNCTNQKYSELRFFRACTDVA